MIFFCLDGGMWEIMEMALFMSSFLFLILYFTQMKVWGNMWEVKLMNFSFDLLDTMKSKSSMVFFREMISVVIFLMILVLNYMSLVPWVYSVASLGQFTILWALSMWFMSVISGLYDFFFHFFNHFVPVGVPLVLSIFMIFIEMISMMIRPITLSVRLIANVSVGHLLMGLGGMMGVYLVSFSLVYLLLVMLELLTAFMQSYVFILLGWIYLGEHE
uniref:ATP synthase subunit a n=1 Tax=Setaphyes kielensis TaxID=3298910 RepID=A0A1I9VTT6_9BILA|nr:ATP synthase F0 subunit 6 [Pycnophyes kielensis]APA17409.1 ATP synthase F0 subunit 6 [Pycnophyes kielensis]